MKSLCIGMLALLLVLLNSRVLAKDSEGVSSSSALTKGVIELTGRADQSWKSRGYVARDAYRGCYGFMSKLPMMRFRSDSVMALLPGLIASGCPAAVFSVAEAQSHEMQAKLYRISCEGGHAVGCDKALEFIPKEAAYYEIVRAKACLLGDVHCDKVLLKNSFPQLQEKCRKGIMPACLLKNKKSYTEAPPEVGCRRGIYHSCHQIKMKWQAMAQESIRQVQRPATKQDTKRKGNAKQREISKNEREALSYSCGIYGGNFCTVLFGVEGKSLYAGALSCVLGSEDACKILDLIDSEYSQ